MTVIEAIISNFIAHFYIVSFISGFLGEEAILFLTFLASQSAMHAKIVFVLAPLGLLLMDIVYFSIGRTGFFGLIKSKRQYVKQHSRIPQKIANLDKKHTFLALLITKFIFSTRIALMIYLGVKKMRYQKFAVYDGIAVYTWAAVMVPLAWLAGRGFTDGLNIVRDFSKIAGFAVLFCAGVYMINKAVAHYFFRKKQIS